MKKIVILLIVTFFFSFDSVKANSINQNPEIPVTYSSWSKHIRFEVTVAGVKITIEGEVSYSIWTGNWTFDGCIDLHGSSINVHVCDVHVNGHLGNREGYDWGTDDPHAEPILNSDEFLTPFEDRIEEEF